MGGEHIDTEDPAMEYYPMVCFNIPLACADASIPVYVIASRSHFALLVPMLDVPAIVPLPESDDPNKSLFNELVEQFNMLAETYVEDAITNDCPLPLPDPEQISEDMSGEFIEFDTNMEVLAEDGMTPKDIPMEGPHFFIAETGVSYEEFFRAADERIMAPGTKTLQ